MKTILTPGKTDDKEKTFPKNILEDLDKKDLEDMQQIFTQDDDEILDIPSMINTVHIE